MRGQTVQSKVSIKNPNGLHLRPITAFAVLAPSFQSQVIVTRNDCRVDGKSPFQMLSLISPQGTELVLEASGPDAAEALAALVDLLENPMLHEDEEAPFSLKG